MSNDDYDYFTMSVKESMSLIFWTSVSTLALVSLVITMAT
jgi:hypothetical protein